MLFPKGHGELSVIEAVDNLSHMAELDLAVHEELTQLTDDQIGKRMEARSWQDPTYHSYNRDRVKDTFQTVLKYMHQLFEKDKGQLRDAETQRGIQALMLLASEAAQKIDNYTEIFKGEKEESVTELKEFKELQHFYLTKVVQRFQTIMESEEKWQEEWGTGAGEISSEGIRDLEEVRRDKKYELFFLRKEDKQPYFNRELLRRLQLVGQFDTLLADGIRHSPFMRIPMIQDKDAFSSAKEILQLAGSYIDDYFKEALKFKRMGFVAAISKSLMALMLAANVRNQMQQTVGKSSLDYYADFHAYLRSALTSQEYRRFISHPPGHTDRFLHTLMNLSHVLCTSFFMRIGSRKEMVAFIHMLIEKGAQASDVQTEKGSPISLWNTLIDNDTCIRLLLKRYPSGPLMKAEQLFQRERPLSGFDPISQQNLPSQMYTIVGDAIHISCLRLPSPTSQQGIAKAQVVDEFSGFLRVLGSEKKKQRHLLINLQDRTSWQEHARCIAIEEVQKEFANALMVITLPKNADFYMQAGPYLELNDAQDFIRQFEEQIASAEQCGFYFPPGIDQKDLIRFSKAAIKAIHTVFFETKEILTHKNRLDFIEIFYLLFILKLIEIFKPDTMSFTCKDAVDTGAAASAEMFAFLRMMNDRSPWAKEEKDFLLWMLYSPALSIRERAIDLQRLNRMTSALGAVNAEVEARYEKTVETCSKLYDSAFFKGLVVKEVK